MNEKEGLHVEYKEEGKLDRSNNAINEDLVNNSSEVLNDSDNESSGNLSHDHYFPSYKWYHINVDFLPVKTGYFFDCAKKNGYIPFQVIFLTSFGLTNTESGVILGLRYIFF